MYFHCLFPPHNGELCSLLHLAVVHGYYDNTGKFRRKKRYCHCLFLFICYCLAHYPPRDAFREQCVWMTIDEAIDVCPMLKKITETAQFQEQLNKLLLGANKFLESKDIQESVKTSLLPVT